MVQLVPMSEADLEAYLAYALPDYAQEHVRAGNWPADEALERAQQQFDELLPEGVATEDHYLYTIQEEASATEVGVLWFMARDWGGRPRAFVLDVRIHEAFRRRGYASQALAALEDRVCALGLTGIVLHVFGHNRPARALYQKLGFVETDLWMAKDLDPAGS
jgi:RimJ/RimL family protein N-acetyltransferase